MARAANRGGTALNVVNGTIVLGAQTGYTTGTLVDNPVLVVSAAGNIAIPTGAPLLSGATVWVVNSSGGAVNVTNTTVGSFGIANGRAQQLLYVSGANWVPVQ